MSTAENKHLIEHVFAELAEGRGAAFRDSLADDARWTISGRGAWSGEWHGKQAIQADLLDPLFAQFADTYTNTAHRVIADGGYVAVECSGRVLTKSGARYDNRYCWVMRIADGKIRDITEYMDTELAVSVLEPPARRAA